MKCEVMFNASKSLGGYGMRLITVVARCWPMSLAVQPGKWNTQKIEPST
jgi:hypothetical protein